MLLHNKIYPFICNTEGKKWEVEAQAKPELQITCAIAECKLLSRIET